MKRILSLMFIGCLCFLQAQLTITTNLREDGVFDAKNMKWTITSTTEGLTVFNFNKDFTSFRHITGSISSNYTIDDYTYNDEEILYDLIVTSDVGNEYDLMIDGLNELIIFFYYNEKDEYCMVRHYIENSFFDE